jgi:hypothetical protein
VVAFSKIINIIHYYISQAHRFPWNYQEHQEGGFDGIEVVYQLWDYVVQIVNIDGDAKVVVGFMGGESEDRAFVDAEEMWVNTNRLTFVVDGC